MGQFPLSSQINGSCRSAIRPALIFFTRYFLILSLLLSLATVSAKPVVAQPAAQITEDISIYLPLVINSKTGPVSPVNGTVLDTLIPVMQYYVADPGGDASGCIGLGTQPNPDCYLWFWSLDNINSYQPWENLSPATQYYWRVGTIINNDTQNPIWSEEWSFTTAPVGGIILPAPNQLTPADNVAIHQSDLRFSWDPVAGAVEYALWISSPTEHMNTIYHTTETSYDFKFSYAGFKTNTPYAWYVTARNDYAWGANSPARNFTLLSVNSFGLNGGSFEYPQATWAVDNLGFKINLRR